MLTLDTSALVALIDRREQAHKKTRRLLDRDPGPFFIPAAMLAETTYLIEARLGARALDLVLLDIENGVYSVDWDADDVTRARMLLRKYHDLDLGFSDAALLACADRNASPVLTLDARALALVARAEGIELVS